MTKAGEGSEFFTPIEHENRRKKIQEVVKELESQKHKHHFVIDNYLRKLKRELLTLDVFVSDVDLRKFCEFME